MKTMNVSWQNKAVSSTYARLWRAGLNYGGKERQFKKNEWGFVPS